MIEVLVLAVLVLGLLLADTRKRLSRLERLGSEETGAHPAGAPPAAAPFRAAPVIPAVLSRLPRSLSPEPVTPEPLPAGPPARPEAPPRARRTVNFEDIAGKQLPIWVGGVALACAAFFLVRYSIELGLFGPRTRSLLAALFGLALLALAELGSWLPRVGRSFAADPRLGQSLAGAGIATLYATLYMAAELYGLVGLAGGFVLVLAITGGALVLALRHGPPTALLGLAGGYVAPVLAGLPDSSVSATAVYLATFTVGLFALALHRRWLWLAWCASAASLLWTVLLLALAEAGERAVVAALILGLGIAGAAVLGRAAGERDEARRATIWRWRFGWLLPALPLVAGMLQLAAFAALADFTALSWAFYLAMAAATLVLARRQPAMVPAVWAALAIAAAAVAGSFAGEAPSLVRFVPPLAFAALFGGAGQWFAYRGRDGEAWARLAAIAPALMLAASAWFVADRGVAAAWGAACIAAAVPAIAIVLRADRREDRAGVDLAVAVVMAAVLAAAGFLLPVLAQPLAWTALFAGLLAWRRRHGGLHAGTGLVVLALAGLAALREADGLAAVPWRALVGARLHFAHLPDLGTLLVALALPGAALLLADRAGLAMRRHRAAAPALGAVLLAGFAYALLKQPLAIADALAFVRWGFVERAIITQALFAGGWLLLRRAGWASPRFRIGAAVAAAALFRVAWFDLLVLNPVLVRQSLGPLPLLNAGTLHAAAVAAWLWALAAALAGTVGSERWPMALRLASLLGSIAAVLLTVRQAVHGAIVSAAPVTRTENYFFSAALLLLALAWLALGIRRGEALLRLAGLALLTAVTVKVFLIDAAALAGLLRVLSFLGLGAALIGIGWVYGRLGPGTGAATAGGVSSSAQGPAATPARAGDGGGR